MESLRGEETRVEAVERQLQENPEFAARLREAAESVREGWAIEDVPTEITDQTPVVE